MRALIVGAGAVGQVYGHHLQQGGADVTFFVKEKYLADCEGGFVLYPLNRWTGPTTPVHWNTYDCLCEVEDVREQHWDQVWLAISSTAVRGDWLAPFLDAIGQATVVSLLPGLADLELLHQHLPEGRVVSGLISLISYQAPLPGEHRFAEPGIAYWFPPFGPSPFSGDYAESTRVVQTLRAGGQPAKRVESVPEISGFPTALMMPYLIALEAAGWRFDDVRRGDHLELASRAARESVAIVAAHHGGDPPWFTRFVGPRIIRWISFLAPFLIPLDIETYLEYHFTKVGDQTRLFVSTWIELGEAHGLPTTALKRLLDRTDAEAS